MSSLWGHPPASLQLGASAIHVWRASLPEQRPRLAALATLLSADEQQAAARFRFARDRERYVITRGLLREILSGYLAVTPQAIRFAYGQRGKPSLAEPAAGCWLRFNLSHAHELALFAFSREQELGVDIEHIRADIEYERIARHFFSPYEVATLLALPSFQRAEAFFRCWTIKESYVKGQGGGLSIPLDQFDCALTPGARPAILATRPDATQASRWTIALLDPGPDYAAALAVNGAVTRLNRWQVEPGSSIHIPPTQR